MLERIVDIGEEIVLKVFTILFILFLFIGGEMIYDAYYVYSRSTGSGTLVYKPQLMDDGKLDTEALKELSSDAIGWITVDDTNIDYPLMQAGDNRKYVNTDPYGEFALSGSIFLDSVNSPDFSDFYNLIYGHHMQYGIMFGSLDNYRDDGFARSHQTGRVVLMDGSTIELTLYAVVPTNKENKVFFSVEETLEKKGLDVLLEEIAKNKKNAEFYCDGPINKLVALSTCSDGDNDRLIIFFKVK